MGSKQANRLNPLSGGGGGGGGGDDDDDDDIFFAWHLLACTGLKPLLPFSWSFYLHSLEVYSF
jgi:hypothetical protein